MQDGRCDVVVSNLEARHLYALLNARPHGREGSRNVIAVVVVVLRDYRSGGGSQAVLMMTMLIAKGTQRLNSVVGDKEEIRVLVHMLQYRSQHLIHGTVLVGKCLNPN